MSLYLSQKKDLNGKAIVLDDMILTTEFPTTAGSKMLEGYKSLFDAEVVSKLKNAGFDIAGKANVGELSLGLLGENFKPENLTACLANHRFVTDD